MPWLLLISVGPLFFAISAQAPLLQRWLAVGGLNPYPLYVASNLGSFCGLIAYPLLLEPMVGVAENSLWWSWGYGVMLLLVAACGLPLLRTDHAPAAREPTRRAIPARTFVRWALIAAVPSGLMLSTTLHLTTDVAPMPLLWVVPLGLYLLSFTIAFAERRGAANFCTAAAPFALLLAAAMLFVMSGAMLPLVVLTAILAMFLSRLRPSRAAVRPAARACEPHALLSRHVGRRGHRRADLRLFAPLLFDWTYEHPLLILAAAFLLGGASRSPPSPNDARRAGRAHPLAPDPDRAGRLVPCRHDGQICAAGACSRRSPRGLRHLRLAVPGCSPSRWRR